MPAFEWVHVQLHQQKGMISLSPPTICNSAPFADRWFRRHDGGVLKPAVLERQRKSKGVPRGEA
ncbi:hypothetical protein FCY11_24705 [Escherichia coli]|nr:hypothetical protein [Escherichia coli]MDN0494611.1 hypothetical protein [Escherichia coli]